MVYIKRDKDGRICAVYSQETEGVKEQIDTENPEFIEFLVRCDRNLNYEFLKSDLQLIRALEDVIKILMDKNIITITDFPQPVIDKLLARQHFRNRFAGAAGMEYKDNEET